METNPVQPVDFGEDAEPPEPDKDKLDIVMDLARSQVLRAQAVVQLEDDLKQAKAALKEIEEGKLPEMLDDLGLTGLDLGNGCTLSIKEKYTVTPPKKTMDQTIIWMEDHGLGGLVKRQIICSFDKGDEAWANKVIGDFKKRKRKVDTKITKGVAPATMRKAVLDMIEAGTEIDTKLFGVYMRRISVVKIPKEA